MADFNKSFELLAKFEFNNSANILHKNPNETGLTYWGIYETANPSWQWWNIIKQEIQKTGSIKQASINLSKNQDLTLDVMRFYKKNYWDSINLNYIESQKVCDEMFMFGVNCGIKQAVKLAQRVVGVADDGIIGNQTIQAINNYDENDFDREFDIEEMKYYDSIIQKNPSLKIYRNGWYNRANSI